MQPESTLGLIFLFLAVVVMAPIGEEVVFRGFLQKFLEEYWKDITRAVLITSLFFAMIHFNPYWTIQIYLLGVVLGFLSWKTKSVIPSIILHSINNGMAFISTVYDEYNVNFYLWGNHVSPVFIIIAIYLSYYSMNKINQINKQTENSRSKHSKLLIKNISKKDTIEITYFCLLYTSPSPRDS